MRYSLPARVRMRLLRLLVAPLLVLAVSGCSLFGSSRPEPPPYPVTRDDASLRPTWIAGSAGKALPGFRPAVTSDGIWVASANGSVRKLDPKDGKVQLEVKLDEKLGAGVGSDGRLVVVVARDGKVIALDDSGRRRWDRALQGEVISPPLVADSAVVVRTVDGRIIALDRDGGSVKWTFKRPMPALVLRQSAPMVLSDDTAFVGMPGAKVMALDLRLGAPRWETVIATPRGATELERLVDVVGAPAVASGEVCAVAYQGKLACMRAEDGRIVWSRDIASASGLAMAADVVVTVDGSDVIQAVKATGDALWKQDGYVRRGLSAPVIVDDRILFTDRFGSLIALSLADGAPLAQLVLAGGKATAPPIVADEAVYIQTLGGRLIAVGRR